MPFLLGTEMVLNFNLTLSNDTIAMYVSIFACAMFALTNLCQGVDFVCQRSRCRPKGFPLCSRCIQLILLGASTKSLPYFPACLNEPCL